MRVLISKGNEAMCHKQEAIFSLSGNNKGLACPFKPITCQEGFCKECQLYFDRQKSEQIVVIGGWGGKVLRREPGRGRSVVSYEICLEIKPNYSYNILSLDEIDR
ncbi:hypothetical protein ACFLYG_01890 [Chloroflexota bacterium]